MYPVKNITLVILLLFIQQNQACNQTTSNYETIKSSIALKRQAIYEKYVTANAVTKDSLVQVAEAYLFEKISNDIFNKWYGTAWDFYGTTQVPGEGKIACGYFVTTVLRDAGFNIPRVKWAQLASEGVIKKICIDIKRFHNSPVEDVEAYIRGKEDGLYIVGLDYHVGFIMKKGKEVSFVHSSYYQPAIGVMKERLKGRNPLNDSKYRVIGRILDDAMVKNWIMGVRME